MKRSFSELEMDSYPFYKKDVSKNLIIPPAKLSTYKENVQKTMNRDALKLFILFFY